MRRQSCVCTEYCWMGIVLLFFFFPLMLELSLKILEIIFLNKQRTEWGWTLLLYYLESFFKVYQVINLNENQMVLRFCSFSYTNGLYSQRIWDLWYLILIVKLFKAKSSAAVWSVKLHWSHWLVSIIYTRGSVPCHDLVNIIIKV